MDGLWQRHVFGQCEDTAISFTLVGVGGCLHCVNLQKKTPTVESLQYFE